MPDMETVPAWIAAFIAAGIFVVFAGYNAWVAWTVHVAPEYARSYAPFIGGIAGLGAVLAMPLGSVGDRLPWSLIPLVLDAGCLPYLMAILWTLYRDRKSRR